MLFPLISYNELYFEVLKIKDFGKQIFAILVIKIVKKMKMYF